MLERELGHGGMAEVYLARDIRLNRRVAIKFLRPDLGAALGPERFLREIDIASRLSHPHILTLFEAGDAHGRLFYAMPYVEGESLRQRLEREQHLPVEEAVAITRAVAGALDYAHREGVIHRDIKPENILLARDPSGGPAHPLVADFGIARALDAAGGGRLTETGLALGTPAYMSPEQASADKRLDQRSDIYSLGCVAYEMLAGQPPFTGPSAQAVLARHSVDPVPPLRTVRQTVPQGVERAITKALAKLPVDRFATAVQFADALTPEAAPVPPLRRGRYSRRTRLVVGMATVAVAITIAVAGSIRLRGSRIPAVLPSAAKIAVLPFLSAASDTALTRLASDLAITVSASLDGVGGVQTADRLGVAQATAGRPQLSLPEAGALARRLGAGSVLRGTLVQDGAKVRLDLALYQTNGLAPLAQGITVTAHRDSLGALTDSVVWALLRRIWQRGEPPTPSLAALTTRSLPALRAFLDGERALEQDRWTDAALAFRGAIAADSTFWLAYFRHSMTQYWEGTETDSGFDRLYNHREIYPERDRLLVEAYAIHDSLPLQLERFREITERFPDYWPGWFLLGDRLYHVGILLGYSWRDAQRAFQQAVALNPRLKPIWLHMFENSMAKDTIESGKALARLRGLPPDLFGRSAEDPAYWQGARLYEAVSRSGGISRAISGLADSAAQLAVQFQGPQRYSFLIFGFPSTQVEFDRRVLRLGPEPGPAAHWLLQSAWAWAERGSWDSALSSMHGAVGLEPNPLPNTEVSALDEYQLAVLGAWLGAIDFREATIRRPAAAAALQALREAGWKTQLLGQLLWFDGILAFARGDRDALDRVREDVRRSGHPQVRDLDHSLAAFDRALAGDRAGAGRDLAALEFHCANRWDCGALYPVPNIAIHRIAAATWLLEAGDTSTAVRLLGWHDAPIGYVMESYAVTPLAYLMQARVDEARGDRASATEHYKQFLRRYDSPMPRQRHLVEEGRAGLQRLSDRGDPVATP